MVKTKDLIFSYDSAESENGNESAAAINGISIHIKKGEFVAILGHNGSGKSTFGKLTNALLLPTSGTVWVDGRDTSQPENVWEIRRRAGMVFQNPDNQIIATIIEEDVAFGPENLGIPSAEIRKRVDSALAAVGMSEYAEKAPHLLSGGQKQRIAIAGTLAMKPECIILDEPTSMLDPSGRKEVIDTIERLNRDEGITVILITHFMDEAARAERVIVMEEGRIAMDDTPRNVFKKVDRMHQLRLDVPQMTELSHSLRKLDIGLPDDIISIDEMVGAICSLKVSQSKQKT